MTKRLTKAQQIAKLLLRPQGCTRKDIMTLTGWTSVSVDQQAKSAGLSLKKEGKYGSTRYYGKKK